eukprot:GHVU01017259.1.p5 GENE.GHVU01017259.1~~GHVU01017259.1.p5  ORF type:complete len:127 (+),score=17.96 GHVU01017259.1:3721-4101(+)
MCPTGRCLADGFQMFGLHQNAEVGYLTSQAEALSKSIQDVTGASAGEGGAGNERAKLVTSMATEFLSRLPAAIDIVEVKSKAKDLTPFVVVSLQEADRINQLLDTIRWTLTELQLGMTVGRWMSGW